MNNPIIQRELVTLLRSRRAVAAQVLATLALAAVVAIRWPTEGTVRLDGSEARQVFAVFVYGLLVLMLLILPVFPATTIVRERQRGTLQLLLDSPMTAMGITFGKLAGLLGFALLLIALSLPAAAACYAMGGIAPWGSSPWATRCSCASRSSTLHWASWSAASRGPRTARRGGPTA